VSPAYQLTPRFATFFGVWMKWTLFFVIFWGLGFDFRIGTALHAAKVFLEVALRRNDGQESGAQ
jgi:hypothetical protein